MTLYGLKMFMAGDCPSTQIKKALSPVAELELAVLIGSRAQGINRDDSDLDIAIQWQREVTFLDKLQRSEALRRMLAKLLSIPEATIDLIDIPRAGLTMRAEIAENGLLLLGDNQLAWSHFLLQVWRDLEEFYWDKYYAA